MLRNPATRLLVCVTGMTSLTSLTSLTSVACQSDPSGAAATLATPAAAAPAAATPAEPAPPVRPARPEPIEPTPPIPAPLVAPDGVEMKPCGEAPAGMACIPGGPFLRGSDDGPENTRPQESIWVQTFYMDIDEVTYAAYQACVAEKKCKRAGPKYEDFDAPDQPINGISWYDAVQYCEAQDKHLPTEAQWEKGARGTDGRLYPWGNEPATCERAILMDESGRSCGVKKAGKSPDKGKPWPVGSRPAAANGLRDMAGNSYEWVADWYSRSWESCGDACRGTDPLGPCGGKPECRGHVHKVVRGGSWYWPAENATTIYRRTHVPANHPVYHHFGFRCARGIE